MATILPFRRKGQTMDPCVVRTADGSMSTNPLRRIVERQCRACHHTYVQAAMTGACPQCHGTDVAVVDIRTCDAPYRK